MRSSIPRSNGSSKHSVRRWGEERTTGQITQGRAPGEPDTPRCPTRVGTPYRVPAGRAPRDSPAPWTRGEDCPQGRDRGRGRSDDGLFLHTLRAHHYDDGGAVPGECW